MLTLLATALAGAYLSRRFTHRTEDGIAITMLDYETIWKDLVGCFVLLGAACVWFIHASRSVRRYCDLALLPWLARRGIQLTIPTIDLPMMPTAEALTDS